METLTNKISITEALAEIKTIGKRLEKKRQAVLSNIGRDSRLKDSLGDSVDYIKRERQSIEDLEKRIVAIRTAIMRSNLETRTTIDGMEKTVAEWLTFRREIADGRARFLSGITNGIKVTREKVQRDGGRVVTAGAVSATAVVQAEAKPVVEVILHVDEKELLEEEEHLAKQLGDLDGRLSLLNATTLIEV